MKAITSLQVSETGALSWGSLVLPPVATAVMETPHTMQLQLEGGIAMTITLPDITRIDTNITAVANLLRHMYKDINRRAQVRQVLAHMHTQHAGHILTLLQPTHKLTILSLNTGSYGSISDSPAEYFSGFWGDHAEELWTACQQLAPGGGSAELARIYRGLEKYASGRWTQRPHLKAIALAMQRQLFDTGRAGFAQRWLRGGGGPTSYGQFCAADDAELSYGYSPVDHANFAKGRPGLNPRPDERMVLCSGTVISCGSGKAHFRLEHLLRWSEYDGGGIVSVYATDRGPITLTGKGPPILHHNNDAYTVDGRLPEGIQTWVIVDDNRVGVVPEGAEQPGYKVAADVPFMMACQYAFDTPILAQLNTLRQGKGLAQVMAHDTDEARLTVLLEQVRTRRPAALCLQESNPSADLGCVVAEDGGVTFEDGDKRFAGVAARKCVVLLDTAQFSEVVRSPLDGMLPMDHVIVQAMHGNHPVIFCSVHTDSDSGPQLQAMKDSVRTQLIKAGMGETCLCVVAIDANLKQNVKAEVTQEHLEAAFAGVAEVAPHFQRHPDAWRTQYSVIKLRSLLQAQQGDKGGASPLDSPALENGKKFDCVRKDFVMSNALYQREETPLLRRPPPPPPPVLVAGLADLAKTAAALRAAALQRQRCFLPGPENPWDHALVLSTLLLYAESVS